MASNLMREVLQARLLSELFRDHVRDGLALKGGMAMRVAYGSIRYTRDIDLAADETKLSHEAVRSAVGAAVAATVRRASSFMKDARFTMPKDTDTTQRWKIEGTIQGSKVNLTVEVSRRGAFLENVVRPVLWDSKSPGSPGPILVDVFSMGMMAASKIDCLCNPNREGPRDLWDLEILATMGVEPDPAMVARIGRERLSHGLRDLWAKIEKMDYPTAKAQLEPYLDADGVNLLTEDRWDEIRLTTYDRTKGWIERALALDGAAGIQPAAVGSGVDR